MPDIKGKLKQIAINNRKRLLTLTLSLVFPLAKEWGLLTTNRPGETTERKGGTGAKYYHDLCDARSEKFNTVESSRSISFDFGKRRSCKILQLDGRCCAGKSESFLPPIQGGSVELPFVACVRRRDT